MLGLIWLWHHGCIPVYSPPMNGASSQVLPSESQFWTTLKQQIDATRSRWRRVELTRSLLATRQKRAEVRRGDHFYYADARHQSLGVMVYSRQLAGQTTVVAAVVGNGPVAIRLITVNAATSLLGGMRAAEIDSLGAAARPYNIPLVAPGGAQPSPGD